MKEGRHEVHERLRAALRRGDPAAGEALSAAEVRLLRRTTLAAAEETPRRKWLPPAAPALAAGAAVCCLCIALALWRVVSPVPGREAKDRVRGEAVVTAGRESTVTAPRRPAVASELGAQAPGLSEIRGRSARAALPDRWSEPQPRARPLEAEQAPTPLLPTRPVFPGSTEVEGLTEAAAAAEGSAELVRAEIAAIHEETRRPATAEPLVASAPEAAAEPSGRQLQFSAPGGTRIIWVLTEESKS